ncbi:MAG: membrane-bound lytic murein transglycosylase F [Candidatus Azotimanducaceae bacterium]|jgi:membrane-bound lytic murein transglycosylase F
MGIFIFNFLAILLLLVGCTDYADQAAKQRMLDEKIYIEQGDLDSIANHGTLRLIAPRFDGADTLPREGFPVQYYQQVAEAFTEHLQLDVQWVFVDSYSELIPHLLSGKGDLIVTNLTVTEARQEQVDFSRTIKQVNEVLVTHKDDVIKQADELETLSLSVPADTAYVNSLHAFAKEHRLTLNSDIATSESSDSDMLDRIQSGELEATVLDSDVAATLLLDYPELSSSLVLKRNRSIAWATRKASPKLLRQLNQFLISHHVLESVNELEQRDWAAIKRRGHLRMLTLNNPASYFMWRGELMGFDFDLVEKFAAQKGLQLSVVLKDNIPELIKALQEGEGDVIAASLTQSGAREAMGLQFSNPYLFVSQQLVGRDDGPSVTRLDQLSGQRVGVNPNTVFYEVFKQLQAIGIDLEILEYPLTTTEGMIDKLMQGEFDFAAADSHFLAIESAHRDNLKVNLTFGKETGIAWALRSDQPELKSQLNTFIKRKYKSLFYNVTYNKYFKNRRKMDQLKAERLLPGGALSPYDDIVKRLTKQYGMDWRLVVAQMYQESKFNPEAKSFAGAVGLMQVMPRTGRDLGYSELNQVENSIGAGVAYMDWLEDRFPGELDLEERLFFTLAAYNVGTGHVRDAQRLTRQLGRDPNRWFGHVDASMLLLAEPEYYKKARFGYARGSEPVKYVKDIRERYLSYLQVE